MAYSKDIDNLLKHKIGRDDSGWQEG